MKSNLSNIEKYIFNKKDDIFKELYNSWIDQIPWYLSTIINNKYVYKSFFILLEIWAYENKIVFFPPEEFYNKNLKKYITPIRINQGYQIWDIPIKDVIYYMRKKIPKKLYMVFNQKMSDGYCFSNFCPRIGWVSKNGKIEFDFE
ncbi:Uncharacterised protein [Campylobacter sputorum subsp. bubulus]|uniref:Uncharacterized protein n=1 Tax=Campylobacter sputorum subsp. sputorum TaxID=32024 RepID=A0A381DHE5_9BACT|nr:hypothetical protein [Campylobacter sputorum]ASM35191.1 hypothetical protein CSPUT_0978 [Campylobacter sputorum aubsp. sputorum RM3237]KAB0581002.1 hypothetical protein F7P64_07745 [Campylobacter sputorum subsp. sputorum]QEL05380.1 hypothetical protein CSPT_0975 [Campylobacter sputorum subsp. sputorum]SUX08810.1 Uncharacterised protein [Campylobacter sputorum subsp. bubulus]SUX10041.1 Uncharacterised protein [Campylobacter sputorum subsp. sputorum]